MDDQHPYDAVLEFHRAFGLPIGGGFDDDKVCKLRVKLMREEATEYYKAEHDYDAAEIADALADIIYIAYGTAISYGIPLKEIFSAVHKANMAKLWGDGKPRYRPDGKVMKPPGWKAPKEEIERILDRVTL